MAQQHRVVFLTKGQMAPENSTGIALANGSIVWIGEEGTFPVTASLGTHLETDPEFLTTYDNREATVEEIAEYDYILANPSQPPNP